MDLKPSGAVVKEQKLRWGSCTSMGIINLNWRLFLAPMRIIDYVIVHELAHLRYHNHSKDFWNLVRSIIPDYEERKEWLRVNGPTLII
jgi:predicted metal-dependent hydrolase